ncbi:MAG: 7-alpha-hydroxysteroid dehydrogenase [Pirellulaceae bacterium]|jgi:7-alpha-hydroxysteroid dehydrogenase|nr:7-alpha-hydroxysteroid dehydrogenase [Pirellulaceae bacterium]
MPIENLFSLKGQAALVTGGGAGIGKAICLLFAEAGADVACTDLKQTEAEAVATECRKFSGKSLGLRLDVTNEAERMAVVERVVKEFGKLTILVNNAGGGGPKPFDMPMGDFEWAFQLNVYSLFRLSQLVHPHMKAAGGGAIVNISSMAGENKNQRMCSYGASKAAVNHLTRNMAFDLGADNVRVNAIAPGAIRTAALATVLTPEIEKTMLKHTPLARLGEGTDIAAAALYLSAPASAWVSGQVLTVSGGGIQELD